MRPRGACVQRPPEGGVSERRGRRPAASEPDPARDAGRGPRLSEAAGWSSRWPRTTAPRSCSTTRSTSATRSTSEHAGVGGPQPVPLRAGLRRRPRDRLRVRVNRPPRRGPRDGRRGAPGARVVLHVLRREPGRVGRALGGRPRRRRCASAAAAASCAWRSTGSSRPAPTRSAGAASRWSRARS